MKVVHITTSHRGGAGTAALRLHNALRQQGASSAYLSKTKTINFEGVEIDDSFFNYKPLSFFKKILRKVKLFVAPSALDHFQKATRESNAKLDYEVITSPWSEFHLENHPIIQEADVINLHWIGGLVDMPTFFRETQLPIVWTLHDMNPFLGIFHYRMDQVKNQNLMALNDSIYNIKREAIATIKTGVIVSPSQWLLQEAKASRMFGHFLDHVCIPNSVDLDVFKPKENLKLGLNLAPTDNVILFTAGAIDIKRKGFDLLLEAIELVTIPLVVLVLGKGEIAFRNETVVLHNLGFVKDQEKIASYYASSDMMVLPSREDNLPNTMLESLATGTPVISFRVGGMIEHLEKMENGRLVDSQNAVSFANGIESFFKNKKEKHREITRAYAEKHFSPSLQANRYLEIYTKLSIASS